MTQAMEELKTQTFSSGGATTVLKFGYGSAEARAA